MDHYLNPYYFHLSLVVVCILQQKYREKVKRAPFFAEYYCKEKIFHFLLWKIKQRGQDESITSHKLKKEYIS